MQIKQNIMTVFHLKKEFTRSSLVLYLSLILVTGSLLQISSVDFFETNDHVLIKIPSIYASDNGGNGNGGGDDGGDGDGDMVEMEMAMMVEMAMKMAMAMTKQMAMTMKISPMGLMTMETMVT